MFHTAFPQTTECSSCVYSWKISHCLWSSLLQAVRAVMMRLSLLELFLKILSISALSSCRSLSSLFFSPDPTQFVVYTWSVLLNQQQLCACLADQQKYSEPGIGRGNEDSRGNENWKSREKIFSMGEENRQAYFFVWKWRSWICECKLKVQNWHSSWMLMC